MLLRKYIQIYKQLFPGEEEIITSKEDLYDKLYNKFNSDINSIKHYKKVLKSNLNTMFKLDLSNYLVILITVLITIFSSFYTHILSMQFDTSMRHFDDVKVISEKLRNEKDMTKPENAKRLEEKNEAIKLTQNSLLEYKENISEDNLLFQIMWVTIACIVGASIFRILRKWNDMCKESFYKLGLDIIEDIEKERENKLEETIKKLNEALINSNNTFDLANKSIEIASKKIEKIKCVK